jgi:hypothetical protein
MGIVTIIITGGAVKRGLAMQDCVGVEDLSLTGAAR